MFRALTEDYSFFAKKAKTLERKSHLQIALHKQESAIFSVRLSKVIKYQCKALKVQTVRISKIPDAIKRKFVTTSLLTN